MSEVTYLGIDNGLDGAMVTLSEDGAIIKSTIMPVRHNGKNRLVDALMVAGFIEMNPDAHIAAEPAAKFSPGKMALCSTWHSWGIIQACLELSMARWTPVDSQRWQKVLLPGRAKGETKKAALEAARRLWPNESWLASPRCKKPHEGLIDAALIAEYARRSRL
jgi:hypothetical protein